MFWTNKQGSCLGCFFSHFICLSPEIKSLSQKFFVFYLFHKLPCAAFLLFKLCQSMVVPTSAKWQKTPTNLKWLNYNLYLIYSSPSYVPGSSRRSSLPWSWAQPSSVPWGSSSPCTSRTSSSTRSWPRSTKRSRASPRPRTPWKSWPTLTPWRCWECRGLCCR